MASIDLKNITKIYQTPTKRKTPPKSVDVLIDFSLSVNDGEFIVITGPSGCGKTSLLRVIAGLEETKGMINIGGKPMDTVPPNKRNIAMVFQEYALYPHLNAFQNMAFGFKNLIADREEIRKQIYDVSRILDIEYLLNRKPKQMSLGQRQRVAIGRAIVRRPDVFLMDEPLSNLDHTLRGSLRNQIAKLHRAYKSTIIYVTHDQTDAMLLGDRIAVLNEGRLIQLDTPQNIYEKPVNTFVATFFGLPPMNLLKASIGKDRNSFLLEFNDCVLPLYKYRFGLEEYIGKNVLFGIRPEDVIENTNTLNSSKSIQAKVNFLNPLGSDTFIHAGIGGCEIVAKSTKNYFMLNRGDNILLSINTEKIHLFDLNTANRIGE